jgi:hypothetical protein
MYNRVPQCNYELSKASILQEGTQDGTPNLLSKKIGIIIINGGERKKA